MSEKEYIERESAIDSLAEYYNSMENFEGYNTIKKNTIGECIERIKNDIPASDVRPVVRGKWLPTNDDNMKRCSECYVITLIAQYQFGEANFCPNCGADMRED